jgi:Cu(I)/Ag(I) efflux system membrane fusion protein
MSERNNRIQSESTDGNVSASAPTHGFWWKVWQVVKVLQARLRFIVILSVVGLVIGYWNTINNYYEKWTRPLYGEQTVASPDVEYFCPMHPFIVRDNRKEKCPICHMDLAKRKKNTGAAEPLPAGTVSRIQLSPYQIVLAAVQTSAVEYRPLAQRLVTFGTVKFNETREAHIAAKQRAEVVQLLVDYTGQEVKEGQKLAILDIRYSPELSATLDDLRRARQAGNAEAEQMARQRLRIWNVSAEQINDFLRTGKLNTQLTITSPIKGHVIKKYVREGNFVEVGSPLYDLADLDSVWIVAQVYEADQSVLEPGMPVSATTLSLPNEVFRGRLDFIYPHLDESSRTLAVRFHIEPNPGHRLLPGMYATVTVDVQPRKVSALARTAAADWAAVNSADILAHTLPSPGFAGLGVVPIFYAAGRQAALQRGLLLTVPDNAVIDTGNLKVVYREASPGVFDGVAVELGPRMTLAGDNAAFYPVLRGLEPGDQVVTNGSFLLDAATRLNPALGSTYYGGSGGKGASAAVGIRPSTPESEDTLDSKVRVELAKLSAEDRRLAEAQVFCPVLQKNRLGSMGPPVKLTLEGQTVFLCCGSCEEKAKANPKKTLATVEELKKRKPAQPAPAPHPDSGDEGKIRANLVQLGSKDQPLAEEQRFCPITNQRLGDPAMGVPVKAVIQGQTVFLCCKGCLETARDKADKTLAKVKELKAKTKADVPKHRDH